MLATPTATDADFLGIESVVGHEYFHNWTGNRITCRDWFQLSLKEGLTVFRDQEFSMDMAGGASARAVKRIEDVRALRQMQFPEDAAWPTRCGRTATWRSTTSTRPPSTRRAEVVRMMQALVGREGFERGMTLYFQRHDGQAVTCDDFAQAIADANPGSPLAAHLDGFKRWYAQAGTPHHGAQALRRAEPHLHPRPGAAQRPSPGQPHKQPFVIPVAMGLVGRDGRPLLRLEREAAPVGTERVLVLNDAQAYFTFVDVDVEPVPSLLRGFSAPVCLSDGLHDAELLVLLAHDTDPFNRWEAGGGWR